jgi:hypothetical protein
MANRIVIYGVDDVLLHTRQAILLKAGVASIITSKIDVATNSLRGDEPALLVVCSSVTELRRGELLGAVDTLHKKNLRKLILSKHLLEEADETVLQTPLPPQTFVSVVRALAYTIAESTVASSLSPIGG